MLNRPQSMDDLLDWLREHDPKLAATIGSMSVPLGGNLICDKYGIRPPKGTDLLDDAMKHILKELKAHAKRT